MIVALSIVALLILGLVVWAVTPEQRLRSAGDLRMHRLGEGVYMYRGFFSNSAIFVMDEGVVVVDTQVSPRAAARLRREIEKITSLPIRYVVNTHYHGDHTGGNALFPEAEIVSTDDCWRYVVERDPERVEYAETFGLEFKDVHPTVRPTTRFSGEVRLDVGGDHVLVKQLGRCETPDACVVWWPARRAIAAGDGVATHDYPFLGVPFMDEGLRDDGEWIGYLEGIAELGAEILVPGHGPAMTGKDAILRRLLLLAHLFEDLIGEVKKELAASTPLEEIAERVDDRLAHYPRRSDLHEHTVGQRFAIYRCLNNMLPERKGMGWWHDLRPSVVVRAPDVEVEAERRRIPPGGVVERAEKLVREGRQVLARTLLERHVHANPDDAAAHALFADLCFEAAAGVQPKVDATEYIRIATHAAKRALDLDPRCALGLLNFGASKVFGGCVLAQPMDDAIGMLTRALDGRLTFRQRIRALFFLGRAHQAEERDDEADRWYRLMLPGWARWTYPILRARVRTIL